MNFVIKKGEDNVVRNSVVSQITNSKSENGNRLRNIKSFREERWNSASLGQRNSL